MLICRLFMVFSIKSIFHNTNRDSPKCLLHVIIYIIEVEYV